MDAEKDVRVKRSVNEKFTNLIYGKEGGRAKWFGAVGGYLAGTAAGLGTTGLLFSTLATAAVNHIQFGKMFSGRAPEPNGPPGKTVEIKRSVNEKISNFLYGLEGKRAKWLGGAAGAISAFGAGTGPAGMVAGAAIGALSEHLMNRKFLTGPARRSFYRENN